MSEHKKRIKGQLFFLLTILLISAVKFSNQKAGELPYLPYITSVLRPISGLFFVKKIIVTEDNVSHKGFSVSMFEECQKTLYIQP